VHADSVAILAASAMTQHMPVHFPLRFNPSAWGHLIPSSYCDVGRFPAGYLNLELNIAGVYAN
jgi:hypothetical protein